jgi:hypothetical protein
MFVPSVVGEDLGLWLVKPMNGITILIIVNDFSKLTQNSANVCN